MNPHDEMDEEMTPELRAALSALPRERDPGRLLEERTVRALREHGTIRGAAAAQVQPPRRIRFTAGWMAGAVAASLALFASGVSVGQYLGARSAQALLTGARQQDTRQAAMTVQQTGSAYVNALSRFAQVADTSRSPAAAQQGREAAAQLLRAAADELVRMSPNDPVASGILAAFDRAKTQQKGTQADTTGKERVVWF